MTAFHAKHFSPSGDVFQCPTPGEAEEDDGLGFYPDGVKRTLTDEQIAMFRHSEIQKLLLERQRREEAEQEELEEAQTVESTAAHNSAEHNKQSENLLGQTESPAETQSNPPSRKKRKRDNNNKNRRTHRRIAREQDEVSSVNPELEY